MNSANRKRRVYGLQKQLEAILLRSELLIGKLQSATIAAEKETLDQLWKLATREQLAIKQALALLQEQEAADAAELAPQLP